MAYTSLGFWLFLAAVLIGVALAPARHRVWWLILASLWFYAGADPMRLLWLGTVMAIALAALAAKNSAAARPVAAGGIVGLILLLLWAKFPDAFGLPDPDAPPGLSFFVFTAIALVVESARQGVGWRLRDGVLHLAWFPKLIAGPIERPQTLIPQFPAIGIRPKLAGLGIALLISGLVKKLVVADNLAPVVDAAYAMPDFATPMDLLTATYFFAFQIYCDFSGYADIALGLSALVGLQLSRNFAHPYLSPTASTFWSSRWHITLGHWFRDYVYIPLGGSRQGKSRQAVNLMIVFLLSGLWHAGLGYGVGWGFVIWGGLNGAFVIVELWVPSPRSAAARIFRTVVTFHLILLTWVFFRAATPIDAITILRRIAAGAGDIFHIVSSYPFSADQRLGAALIGALGLVEIVSAPKTMAERIVDAAIPLRWAGLYAGMIALLVMGRWQDTGFIYAGF